MRTRWIQRPPLVAAAPPPAPDEPVVPDPPPAPEVTEELAERYDAELERAALASQEAAGDVTAPEGDRPAVPLAAFALDAVGRAHDASLAAIRDLAARPAVPSD